MSTFTDNATAVAALNKVAEIKQYGLQEDYRYLIDSDLVRSINEQARAATGIDLLDDARKLTFSDIDKYEAFLDRIIERSLPVKYSESFLADEIELLNRVEDFPLNDYRSLSIVMESFSPFVKRFLKIVGVTLPSALVAVRNPIRAQYLDIYKGNIFAISKLEIRSKDYFMLWHISLGQTSYLAGKPQKLSSALEEAEVRSLSEVSILTCMLFSHSNLFINSPINMFLQGITRYAREITIDFVTKKFFLEGHSSSLMIRQGDELIFEDGFTSNIAGSMYLERTHTGMKYSLLYALNFQRLQSDFINKTLL